MSVEMEHALFQSKPAYGIEDNCNHKIGDPIKVLSTTSFSRT